MRRTKVIIVALLIFILAAGMFTACGKAVPNDADTLDYITLKVEVSKEAESAQVTVQNSGKQKICFGEEFYIQKRSEDNWKDVKLLREHGANLVLFQAPAGEGFTYTANWKYLYGPLPAGEYRIIKPYQTGDTYKTDGKIYYVYGEFTVD